MYLRHPLERQAESLIHSFREQSQEIFHRKKKTDCFPVRLLSSRSRRSVVTQLTLVGTLWIYSQLVLHQQSWRADPAPKHSETWLGAGWLKAKGWVTQPGWVRATRERDAEEGLPPPFELVPNQRREWKAAPCLALSQQTLPSLVYGQWFQSI